MPLFMFHPSHRPDCFPLCLPSANRRLMRAVSHLTPACSVTATKNPYTPTLDYYTAFCLPNDCDHDLVPSVETWLTNAECTNIPHSMCSVNLDCKYSTSPLVIVAIIFVGLVGAIIVVGSLCYAHEWWRGRRRHMSSIEQSGLLDEERPDLMEPRL